MAGHYCFSVLLSFIYFFVDLTLWILGMMVCLNRAMMVNTIHEILDENAPNLLAMRLGALSAETHCKIKGNRGHGALRDASRSQTVAVFRTYMIIQTCLYIIRILSLFGSLFI